MDFDDTIESKYNRILTITITVVVLSWGGGGPRDNVDKRKICMQCAILKVSTFGALNYVTVVKKSLRLVKNTF